MSYKAAKTSKKDDKPKYYKTYLQYGHDGTKTGHIEWKSKGELYHSMKKEHLIAKVLNGTFDVQPLLETWPYKPDDWEPTILGTPRESDVTAIETIPTEEQIELDEIELLGIEDTRSIHEEAIAKLTQQETKSEPEPLQEAAEGSDEEQEALKDETSPKTYAQAVEALKTPEPSQDDMDLIYHKTAVMRCRVKARKLRKKIEEARSVLDKTQRKADDSELDVWTGSDIIFQDNKRMKPITIYANEMEEASPTLMLWMSTTAGDVIKGSIKKMEVGYKDSSIKGFIVLDRLNLKFGKDTSATGNVGLIGRAVSLNFLYGKETAISYIDRMLDMIEEVVGHDELIVTVKAALPTIFLGRIHNPKYGAYCELATRILLDPEFKELSLGPYKEFRAKLHTTEQTMKCFSRSVVEVKASKEAKKAAQEQANAAKDSTGKGKGAKKKGGKKNETANSASDAKPKCFNCDNNRSLLKHYKEKPHKTGDCPFQQSAKQREYYKKGKTAVDLKQFPEFGNAAEDLNKTSSSEGSNE